MRVRLSVLLAVVLLACLIWAAVLPHHLVDGDSCLHAALARDMAAGEAADWVAPRWALHGAWTWYRDQPPGAFWSAALLGEVLEPEGAARVANLLWTVLAAFGVFFLARQWLAPPGAWLAAAIFLLHVPVIRYVQRFGLELPLAACVTWSAVSALRLKAHGAWTLVLALSLAGAFLVRGIFGGVAVGVVAWILLEPSLRPPLLRVLIAVLWAAALLLAFDRGHASVTGEGFWGAYIARQVAPSLAPGGGAHGQGSRQFVYFTGRLLLYGLPWLLLPAWALLRRRRSPLEAKAAWRLLAIWVFGTWLGASLTVRPASRYLFAAWPAAAVLAGLAWPAASIWGRRVLRLAPAVLALALCVPLVVKTPNRDNPWSRTAAAFARRAEAGGLPPAIRGPFDPEDARLKSLLRFHLGVPAISGPPRPGDWRMVPIGEDLPPGTTLVLDTEKARFVAESGP